LYFPGRLSVAISPPVGPISSQAPPCPVCGNSCEWLDALDFNRSCDEGRGKVLPKSGVLVCYALCHHCAFCFAPQLYAWQPETFERWIYNDRYVEVDPDYLDVRPRANADSLNVMFVQGPAGRHLDYGGGNGMLADILRTRGWDSISYDPFLERKQPLKAQGQFELITAFEVFEHVPDVSALIADLAKFRAPNGMILFSTLVSDAEVRPGSAIKWWYAAPRNGHISLFSRKSLQVVAHRLSLNFGSFSADLHAFFGSLPHWAQHLMTRSR
jgi:SAM-dependent methyltransferase